MTVYGQIISAHSPSMYSHILGNILGMAALLSAVHPVHRNYCIRAVLYLSPASSCRYGTTTRQYQTALFTDISHELRTPLTLIGSPVAEVLENEPLSDCHEHLTLVRRTRNDAPPYEQILDFRKIQNQKMKLLVEETDLISLCKSDG